MDSELAWAIAFIAALIVPVIILFIITERDNKRATERHERFIAELRKEQQLLIELYTQRAKQRAEED